jgi:hypothetical protein
MNSDRKTALVAGLVFVVATAANLLATAVEQPVLAGPGYLAQVAGNVNRISIGGLMELIAAGTSAGIAIALYPVLKRWSAGLALGSVVFRAIEAVMYTVAALALLSLPAIGQSFTEAVNSDRAWFQAIGDALLAVRQEAVLAGVFAFIVRALMYYVVFFRSGLVPRWLSGWGIVAEIFMLAACLAALFSRNPVTSYTILALPIAVQEMVLAVWLIAKGFSPLAHRSETVSQVLAA